MIAGRVCIHYLRRCRNSMEICISGTSLITKLTEASAYDRVICTVVDFVRFIWACAIWMGALAKLDSLMLM